jgi:hypothetical protein
MGLCLSYTEYGAGPPLVILHGKLGSSNNWRSIAKQLASTYHVFSVDLRNHVQSPWHEDMSYAEIAEDLRDFIRQQNLQFEGEIYLKGVQSIEPLQWITGYSLPIKTKPNSYSGYRYHTGTSVMQSGCISGSMPIQ